MSEATAEANGRVKSNLTAENSALENDVAMGQSDEVLHEDTECQSVDDTAMQGTSTRMLSLADMQVQDTSVMKRKQGLQYVTPRMTFENKVLQSGDYSSCTPISNLLRGRSAKGPPYEATVEKLVQQALYETEIDRTSWIRYLTL